MRVPACIVLSLLIATVATAAEVSLDSRDWELSLDVSGFTAGRESVSEDGLTKKAVFVHPDNKRRVTVLIQPVGHEQSLLEIRDERWSKIRAAPPREVKAGVWEEEDRAGFAYSSEFRMRGAPMYQRHTHTFFVHGASQVEVHATIAPFTHADQAWLDALSGSLGIRAKEAEGR